VLVAGSRGRVECMCFVNLTECAGFLNHRPIRELGELEGQSPATATGGVRFYCCCLFGGSWIILTFYISNFCLFVCLFFLNVLFVSRVVGCGLWMIVILNVSVSQVVFLCCFSQHV